MIKKLSFALLLTVTANLGIADNRGHMANYEVTITNITSGQTFTPQLVITHPQSVELFELGKPASEALAMLAEGGDTALLTAAVIDASFDVQTIPGLLGPGESASIVVKGKPRGGYLSIAAMLIPTNDTFVALTRLPLPLHGRVSQMLPAYDAGTEYNDQNCLNIPGPVCGGEGYSVTPSEMDEGFVHIGNGMHELGEYDEAGNKLLAPKIYDWRNSVAKITVKRMR